MGPQNGEPLCPCMMRCARGFVKRDGQWVEPERVIGQVQWHNYKRESGFEDLDEEQPCIHPEHNPPTHLFIPPGKQYRHVCPGCEREVVLRSPQCNLLRIE